MITPVDELLTRTETTDLEKQDCDLSKHRNMDDLDVLYEELAAADVDEDTKESKSMLNVQNFYNIDISPADIVYGLTAIEVLQRRKKHGFNQLKEAKENFFFKFILFFVGPIQFVMEVRYLLLAKVLANSIHRPPLS